MGDTANVLIGLLAAAFGAVMMVWVIPAQTVPALFASVPSGFYPNIGCGLMIVSGGALAISGLLAKRAPVDRDAALRQFATFAAAAALLSAVTLAMPHVGFFPAGAAACIAILLFMGMRSPVTLIAVAALTPAVIWVFFELLLDRPLP